MTWEFIFGRLLTLVLVGQVGLILWNLRVVVRPKVADSSASRAGRPGVTDPVDHMTPLVSILVPARDEEGAIGDCLQALMRQTYARTEVLVLDDRSSDETAAVVDLIGGSVVQLIEGAELPPGWTGKNWACHQLSQRAQGEILCFVDADTVLEATAVAATVGSMMAHDAGLAAVLVRSRTDGIAEALILPMINHAILGLFPASLIHRSGHPDIAVALGPFITVSRAAYDDAGGHAAHPAQVVDDMRLARSVKAAGHEVRLFNGTDIVTTTWYRGVREIWAGFSKNAFGGLGGRLGLAMLAVFVAMPLLLLPFVRATVGAFSGGVPGEVAVQVGLLLTGRLITSIVGRDPLWTVPLHPFTVAFWAATLTWSTFLGVTGRSVTWKGRRVEVG